MEADRTLEAHRTSADIKAADLYHDEWNNAPAARLTRYWSGLEAPPLRHAEARIIWTNNALSVRFICRQGEPLVTSDAPQVEHKTPGLWERDVCEIFVAPDARSPQRYLEFEAAPTGEWLDLAIEHSEGVRETDGKFDSGMTAAARISEGVITIALSVPWAAFGGTPQANDSWRVNLFRCIGTTPERGYLAWQPTRTPVPDFHVPAAFGWLKFKDEG